VNARLRIDDPESALDNPVCLPLKLGTGLTAANVLRDADCASFIPHRELRDSLGWNQLASAEQEDAREDDTWGDGAHSQYYHANVRFPPFPDMILPSVAPIEARQCAWTGIQDGVTSFVRPKAFSYVAHVYP
jgi:hypothetical protein